MRRLSIAFTLAHLCVVATAMPARADITIAAVAGRWHSPHVVDHTRGAGPNCQKGTCGLTLDIVACGDGWCGIEIGENNSCGATALKFDAGKVTEHRDGVLFSGKLELAKGTEPYVVEAYMRSGENGAPAQLSITGDTGGEFRVFRRSFPFHASLARTGEGTCRLEKPVS